MEKKIDSEMLAGSSQSAYGVQEARSENPTDKIDVRTWSVYDHLDAVDGDHRFDEVDGFTILWHLLYWVGHNLGASEEELSRLDLTDAIEQLRDTFDIIVLELFRGTSLESKLPERLTDMLWLPP